MHHSKLVLAILGAITSTLARAATTTSDSSIVNLFVIDPTGALPSPTIHASIIRVVPSLTQTEYYITCAPLTGDQYFGKPKPAPCNHIDGASVTINPTGMTLHLVRTSQVIDGRQPELTKETAVTVYEPPSSPPCVPPPTTSSPNTPIQPSSPILYHLINFAKPPITHSPASPPRPPHISHILTPVPGPQKSNSHLRLERVHLGKLHRRHDQLPDHDNLLGHQHPDGTEHRRSRDHLERLSGRGRAQ